MPTTTSVPTDLGALTWRFQRTLRHLVAQEISAHGLALAELGALRTVQLCPGVTNADLARALDVTPQASNQLVLRLADRGLLTREPHPTVARGLAATLTPAGERLADAATAAAETAYAEMLAPLDRAEAQTLVRALQRCTDAVTCHPDHPPTSLASPTSPTSPTTDVQEHP